jgi:S-adenosylmethionine decarboxylase
MPATTTLKLGMNSEAIPSDAQAEIYRFPQDGGAARDAAVQETAERQALTQTTEVTEVHHGPDGASDENADHFISRDGKTFAGTHLIVDVYGGSRLDDIEHIRQMMHDAVTAAGATLLHTHLHHFTPNGGVSGVAVLAESHISIHTWPERDYGALDVFMCGDSAPEKAVEVIRAAFQPAHLAVGTHLRGEEVEEVEARQTA